MQEYLEREESTSEWSHYTVYNHAVGLLRKTSTSQKFPWSSRYTTFSYQWFCKTCNTSGADWFSRTEDAYKDLEAHLAKVWLESAGDAPNERNLSAEESLNLSKKLMSTTYAPDWAKAFMEVNRLTNMKIDEDLMISWFANAIEAGRSFGEESSRV